MTYSIPFLRKLCDASFFHFVHVIGGSVKQGYSASKEIDLPICNFLQNPKILRPAVAKPRGTLKSTIDTKLKTMWDYTKNRESRHLMVSETVDLSGGMLRWIQNQFLQNELFRKIYADILTYTDEHGNERILDRKWIQEHRWNNTECDLPRDGFYTEPSIRAIGIGGAAQGGHYTDIHIDDLVGERARDSITIMGGVYLWFDNCTELLVQPDMTKPNASKITLIGTHWGLGDFFCYVQEKYPEYKWIIVPARRFDVKPRKNIIYLNNPNVEPDESNHPQLYSTEYYVDLLNSEKSEVYWAQHMNMPEKGTAFNKLDKEWLRYYEFRTIEDRKCVVCLNDKGEETDDIFIINSIPRYAFLDPGGFADKKRLAKGSRNAIVIGGQAPGTVKKFIFHTWAKTFAQLNKDPNNLMDVIFDIHKEWQPRIWRIDTVGTQPYIYYDIMSERKKRKLNLPISPIDEDPRLDSKDTDIEALMTPAANGEFYIHRTMKNLIDEWAQYPSGLTRDILDMIAKMNKLYFKRSGSIDAAEINLKRQDTFRERGLAGY